MNAMLLGLVIGESVWIALIIFALWMEGR